MNIHESRSILKHEKQKKRNLVFHFVRRYTLINFTKSESEVLSYPPRVILSTLIILIIVGFIGKLSFNSSKIIPIIESATIAKSS